MIRDTCPIFPCSTPIATDVIFFSGCPSPKAFHFVPPRLTLLPMLLSPVTAPTALPTAALMAWTRSGCFSTQAFPLAARIRPFMYSPTPPANVPVAIFPPARELSSPPKILWASIFSSLPSCQPLRAASSWMARFPTLLSSFTSSCFSWAFSLSKMVANL